MFFSECHLRNFRNFSYLFSKFKYGVNIFIGENGEGKTNLLEALILCVRKKGFRNKDISELIKKKAMKHKFVLR